nr:Beta-galactosidase C-terminal domain [Opitutaceae bacterium]
GKGEALYLATQPEQAFLETWLAKLLAARGIHAPVSTGPTVEISPRRTDTEEFLFVINHDRTPAWIDYDTWAGAEDLLAPERPVPPAENLPPFAVRILRRQRA